MITTLCITCGKPTCNKADCKTMYHTCVCGALTCMECGEVDYKDGKFYILCNHCQTLEKL